ncbi:DUF1850 domain-containing protein [bacterium 3DAC]|nr:DUF1850 domain-containing protein [bacterium 3DAC]
MRKSIIFLIVVAVVAATTFYISCLGSRHLVFHVTLNEPDGSVKTYTVDVPVGKTATLTVVYKHSVIRLDVKDIIRVDDRDFHALWSELPDFGAGLPAEGAVEVATISDTASDYRVTVTGERDFKHLTYLMIPLNRYRFYVDGKLVLMPEVKKTGRVDIEWKRGCLLWQR